MGIIYMTPSGEIRSLSPRYYQQQIATIEEQEAQKKIVAQQQVAITQQQRSFGDVRGTSDIPQPIGPTFQQQAGAWSKSVTETWVGPSTPEDVLRDVFLFWQPKTPERKAREKAYWEKQSPEETARIYRQRAEQGTVAAIAVTLASPFIIYGVEKTAPKIGRFLSEKTGYEKLNQRFETWLLKRSEEGKMIQALSWEPTEKQLAISFERAFPTDITKTMTYKEYPGFETWATWQEPSKYAGYPTLRSLSAAPMQALKTSVESSIFGPSAVFEAMPPAKQLLAWETWATAKEAHPYAGYPVIYREITGIRLVKEPSAFEQILQGIEKGRFYRMGGLAATQVPTFAKPQQYYQPYPQVTTGKTAYPTFTPQTILESANKSVERLQRTFYPELSLIGGLKPFSWELEKQKYRLPDLLKPEAPQKQRQTQIPLLKLLEPQKQKQTLIPVLTLIQPQKQKAPLVPVFPFPSPRPTLKTPTPPDPISLIPKVRLPPIFKLGGGEGGGTGAKSLFGKWFKKSQQIKTPQQMLQTFFGSKQRRKHR